MEDDNRTVWCGNLSDEVTEEILYELFLQAAPVQRVHIPKNKDGRKSNYAFIVFDHLVSVMYAVQLLNGTTLFNKPLIIRPRSKNQVTDNPDQFNFRDRVEKPWYDSHRSPDTKQYHAQAVQPTYSSSVDRRPNHFTDSWNNRHHQDEREPYSRNDQKFVRNQHQDYEKERHYYDDELNDDMFMF